MNEASSLPARDAKSCSIELADSKKHVTASPFIPAPRSPFHFAQLPLAGPAAGSQAAGFPRGDSKAGKAAEAEPAQSARQHAFVRDLANVFGPDNGSALGRKFIECLFVFGAEESPDGDAPPGDDVPDPVALCVDLTRVDPESAAAIFRVMETSGEFARLFHAFARDSGFEPRFGHRVFWKGNAPVSDCARWPQDAGLRCVTRVGSDVSERLVSRVAQYCSEAAGPAQLDPEKFAEITPETTRDEHEAIVARIRAGFVTSVARQLAAGVGLLKRDNLSCVDFRSCYHFLVRRLGWEAAFELVTALENDPEIEEALVELGRRRKGWDSNVRVVMPMRPVVRDPVALQLARRAFLGEDAPRLLASIEDGKEAARLAEVCWGMLVVSGNRAFIDNARVGVKDQERITVPSQLLIEAIIRRAFEAGVTVSFLQRFSGVPPLSWRELARSSPRPLPSKEAIDAMAEAIYAFQPQDPGGSEDQALCAKPPNLAEVKPLRKAARQVLTQCVRSIGKDAALIDLTRFRPPQFMMDRGHVEFNGDLMCDVAQAHLDVDIRYELLPIDPNFFKPGKDTKADVRA